MLADDVVNPLVLELGDFNQDQLISAVDIDLLSNEVRTFADNMSFDTNRDGTVNQADRTFWIEFLGRTYSGDANFDGEFSTTDLVTVFQSGTYEDDDVGNSTWATGDWNGDAEFTTSDLVTAFQGGGFEIGRRQLSAPNIRLAEESDSPPLGDRTTIEQFVRLVGTSEPFSVITLPERQKTVFADFDGNFQFSLLVSDLWRSETTAIEPFSRAANKAPVFDPVGPLTVVVGDQLSVSLPATDPEGGNVTFSLIPNGKLPATTLRADGTLVIAPHPGDEGSYNLTLVATDGVKNTSQEISLSVQADILKTTRLSGIVLNTLGEPLAGIPMEIGEIQSMTAADGSFVVDVGDGPFPDDTLRIHGEEIPGAEVYPFVAEKLGLILGFEPLESSNNTLPRPIFLPAIDVEGGTEIDPSQDTMVRQQLGPGDMAMVEVAAGSLKTELGTDFTGVLSITDVPNELTPAALPDNLFPDTVVTIQPAEMVFTRPAPLSLPNRAGYAPGTEMELWSINPETGAFDRVGLGVVTDDGEMVETIQGGIRSSSWHFVAPPSPPFPQQPPKQPRTPQYKCKQNQCGAAAKSDVLLHSGELAETVDLANYQSMGVTRGLTLTYRSFRADPRPIIHFGFDDPDFPRCTRA